MTVEEIFTFLTKGANCSQAVLLSAAEELGISQETAMKIAAGFGGGMYSADTCGCVTGAIMALGLKYGWDFTGNQSDRDTCRDKILEFKERFKEENGSIYCRELLGADISTPEGVAEVEQKNLKQELCPKLMASASEILADLLDD